MMVGALVTAIMAGTLAVLAYKRKKPKLLLSGISVAVAAIPLFAAFPALMLKDTIIIKYWWLTWLILVIGLLVAMVATTSSKVPTWFMPIGITVAVWALFMAVPNISTAFTHLGPNLDAVGKDLWAAAKVFFQDLTS